MIRTVLRRLISFYCWLQETLIYSTKCYVLSTLYIVSLPIFMLRISGILLSYLLLQRNEYLHFATLRLSLFCISKSIIPSNSLFRSSKRCREFSLLEKIFVSSAYIFGCNVDRYFTKSFVKRMNRRGPKHDPCGIPKVTSCFSEFF